MKKERIQIVRQTNLTYFKKQITKEKKSQLWAWHNQKITQQESCRSKFYIFSLKAKIDPLLAKTKKLYVAQFYQLKIRYGAIGIFLTKIKIVETNKYWQYRNVKQFIMHLYTKYRKWRVKRQVLKKNLGKAEIKQQKRPENKQLTE